AVARRARRHREGVLPWPAESSAARTGEATDERLRRDGVARPGGRRADAARGAALHPVRARGIAGWCRVPARTSRLDDTRLGAAGDAPANGTHRFADPALGGGGGRGGPDRGPGAGAREVSPES